MSEINFLCPLCDLQADSRSADHAAKKVIFCAQCGNFSISRIAEARTRYMSPRSRRALSVLCSKSPAGKMRLITQEVSVKSGVPLKSINTVVVDEKFFITRENVSS